MGETLSKLNQELVDNKKHKIQLQADLDSQKNNHDTLLGNYNSNKTAHEKEISEIRTQTRKMLAEQKALANEKLAAEVDTYRRKLQDIEKQVIVLRKDRDDCHTKAKDLSGEV